MYPFTSIADGYHVNNATLFLFHKLSTCIFHKYYWCTYPRVYHVKVEPIFPSDVCSTWVFMHVDH